MNTLRTAREGQKLTLRQMAKKLGLSPTFLSMVERGECKIPKDRIEDLEGAYGITLPKSEEWKAGYHEGYDDGKTGKEKKA